MNVKVGSVAYRGVVVVVGIGAGAYALVRAFRRKVAAPGNSASEDPESGLPSGLLIGSPELVPVGGALSFIDRHSKRAAYVVQPIPGEFRAFSAVCTHAPCIVYFQDGDFVCPCHRAAFDGKTGAVLHGPPRTPLPAVPILVRGGKLFQA